MPTPHIDLKIATINDLDDIYLFEKQRITEQISNETDREIHSWTARWRKESLELHLPMGWSFIARDTVTLRVEGYFLAQPLMFFDGQTQSLWIEQLSYSSLALRDALCDLAVRLSKEKHFQGVIFPNSQGVLNSIAQHKPEPWSPPSLFVKTTR